MKKKTTNFGYCWKNQAFDKLTPLRIHLAVVAITFRLVNVEYYQYFSANIFKVSVLVASGLYSHLV